MGLQFRNFVTIISSLGIVYNSLCAYLLYRLADQVNPLPINVTLYSIFAATNNLLGLYGSITEHTFTLAIFANFLILDIIICAIPRAVGIYLLSTLNELVCEDGTASPYLSLGEKLDKTHVAVIGRIHHDSSYQDSSDRCRSIFQLALVAVAVGSVVATLIQMFFAILVRRYSMHLIVHKEGMESEKQPYQRLDHEERMVEKSGNS